LFDNNKGGFVLGKRREGEKGRLDFSNVSPEMTTDFAFLQHLKSYSRNFNIVQSFDILSLSFYVVLRSKKLEFITIVPAAEAKFF